MTTIGVLRDGVLNPEGPVSLRDGSWLCTEMDLGVISHIGADGRTRREIARTGLPNGLAVDGQNGIWVAEALERSLLRVTMSGETTTVSTGCPDLPFLLPNDLCFGPDRAIYLTDSGILLSELRGIARPEEAYELAYDGRVYRIDPFGSTCEVIDRGLRLTNGIAFGPNDEWLYVAETLTGNIYRYPFSRQGVAGPRELFGNVMKKAPIQYGRIAGPDGMAFDAEGNLYVAVVVEGDIVVLGPRGEVVELISLEGTVPTNLAFDCSGMPRMLVTEASRNQLLLLGTEFPGLSLHI